MKLKEFNILLDIKEKNNIKYIEVVQDDYNSNVLNISLIDELNSYDLTDLNVEIAFKKPDGTTVLQDKDTGVSIIDAKMGKIKCILSTNTIACPGIVNAEVRISESSNVFTSARFNFYVRQAIFGDTTIKSKDEWPLYDQLLKASESESERINAESTRNNNETNRINAENERKSNEINRVNTESKRVDAESVRQTNEDTRKNNENTRQSNESARVTEFNSIKSDYSTYKNVMTSESNVANLQSQINNVNSQLTDNATKVVEETANSISLPSAVDGILNFELQGNTLQNLVVDGASREIQAVNNRTIKYKLSQSLKSNTVYTLICDTDTNYTNSLSAYVFQDDLWDKRQLVGFLNGKAHIIKTVTIDANYNYNSLWVFDGNETDTNIKGTIKNVMLLEGDWTNKQIPAYFEGIKSVGEGEIDNKIEVLSCGKNLVNVNTDTLNDYFVDISGVYRYAAGTKSIIIKVTQGKQYTLSKNGGDRDFYGFFSKLPTTHGEQSLSYGESLTTSIAPAGAKYLVWYVSNVGTAFPTNIQVEEGAVTTPYEPYKVDKIDISYTAPIRGLPNGVRDTHGSDGILMRKIKKDMLNGSENWSLASSRANTILFSVLPQNIKFQSTTIVSTICDKLSSQKQYDLYNTDIGGVSISETGKLYVAIEKSKLSTQDVAGFKAWLQTNPVTVYYELAEPVVEDTKQPLSLKCFKGGSLQTNTAIPPVAIVRYLSNINSRLQTTEEAMANMSDSLGGAWKTLLSLADRELKMKSIAVLTTETTTDLKNKINEMIGAWK